MHFPSLDGITWKPSISLGRNPYATQSAPADINMPSPPAASPTSTVRSWCMHATSRESSPPAHKESLPFPTTEALVDGERDTPPWGRESWDPEIGCAPFLGWRDGIKGHAGGLLSWWKRRRERRDIDAKLDDVPSCRKINYSVRPKFSPLQNALRFSFYALWGFTVSIGHRWMGLQCGRNAAGLVDVPKKIHGPQEFMNEKKSPFLMYVEAFVSMGAIFLMAHGQLSIRACRERMERVKQHTTTLAYCLLKTTNPPRSRTTEEMEELQLLTYEVLALTTAYPVALLQQMLGNTCEPDVTRYCREVAQALKHLREGGDVGSIMNPASQEKLASRRAFTTVDYFFEVFVLQLEREFVTQSMRTMKPSMVPQHIIYNIRNHFENLVDGGNVDDRKTPILRENIDMLGMAGRECTIHAYTDIIPITFLWVVDIAAHILTMLMAPTQCEWLSNDTRDSNSGVQFPTMTVLFCICALAVFCTVILLLVDEMWSMWKPFETGVNAWSWTLGIATEIDMMVNEFYEWEAKSIVRRHGYVAGEDEGEEVMQGLGHYLRRALTV